MRLFKWSRSAAVVALVGATSTGLIVSATPAAAWDIVYGPAERMVIQSVSTGIARGGVAAAGPATLARMEGRCIGPQIAGCTAAVVAVGLIGYGAYATSDYWLPWLEEQAGIGVPETTGGEWAERSFVYTILTPPSNDGAMHVLQMHGVLNGDVGFASPSPIYAQSSCKRASNGETYNAYKVGGWPAGQYGPWGNYNSPAFMQGDSTGWTAEGSENTGQGVWGMAGQPADTVHGLCNGPDKLLGTSLLRGNVGPAWYTWGAPPEPQDPGPISTKAHCKRPDGTEYEVTKNELPVNSEVLMAHCDPGDTQTGIEIDGVPVDTQPEPADVANYPACQTSACHYRIMVDGIVCTEGVAACTYWTVLERDTPARVQCQYGPYTIATDLCYFLERAYQTDPNARVVTKPNTDGNPDTWTPPAPSPSYPTNPDPAPSPTPSVTPQPTTTVTATPSPTVTVTAPTSGSCTTTFNLGPVHPITVQGVNTIAPMFDVTTVYGYREVDAYPDHPSGLAADFMVGTDFGKGTYVADYAKANASALGVDYIIWNQRIWSPARSAEGWRLMEDRGSDTANHKDHTHITFKNDGLPTCSPSGDPGTGNSGECFPAGWGALLNPIDYVVKPLRCVFIPRPGFINGAVAGIVTKIEAKGPGDLIDTIGGIGGGIDNGAGCSGPTFPFAIGDYHLDMKLLDACTGTMATVAGYVKAFLTVVISVGGVMGVIRGIGTGFGWQFSLGRGSGGGES